MNDFRLESRCGIVPAGLSHILSLRQVLLVGLLLLGVIPSAIVADEPITVESSRPVAEAPVAEGLEAGDSVAAPVVDVRRIFAGEAPTSLAELRAMEQRQQELSDEVQRYTVGVRVGAAQGSGVIVSKDGYVLTAAHVAGKPNLDAVFFLPDGARVRGKTLGMNRTVDAGLMKINTIIKDGKEVAWPYAEIGRSSDLKLGQWCLATGHPGGFLSDRSPVVRVGRILSSEDSVVRTDCKLVGGDSGGPLFDMEGRVIGIHSRIGPSLELNMHVPVNQFMDDWDRMVGGEDWGNMPGVRPVIGVEGVPGATEAKIGRVVEKGPADEAGMKQGDVVISFDRKPVTSFAQLQQFVRDTRPGDKVKVVVRRGSEELTLELTVENLGRRGRGR